jgi:hypothetical protein
MVLTLQNNRNVVEPGQVGKPLGGSLPLAANAVALGLVGDRGYWILPAGLPDVQVPDELTFSASLSFSPLLPLGPRELEARAVDRSGRFGPVRAAPLEVQGSAEPAGQLVVSLRWTNRADLDLRVTDPRGVEVWARNINSYTPPLPGAPVEPDGPLAGGVLDFDANGACIPTGRRRENVVWTQPPPSGRYLVRVDAPSLCREPSAPWSVQVVLRGATIGAAEGVALEADTRPPHGLGAGRLAVEFTVP